MKGPDKDNKKKRKLNCKYKFVAVHVFMFVTYLRVSLVLQVEQAKQLTHQALLRADTTEKTQAAPWNFDCIKKQLLNLLKLKKLSHRLLL